VAHDVGDLVSPGDLLLEIDAADFQLAVREHARARDSCARQPDWLCSGGTSRRGQPRAHLLLR
jgi:multidrug resistance efflux pump